jgi:uncharacterized membrane protein YebE (DUF533 family)
MDAIKLLGGLLGNQSLSSGLGGKLLGGLLGGGSGGGGGGGIGNILGSVLGGGGGQQEQQAAGGGGGLGGILGSVLGGGGGQQEAAAGGAGGLGGLLGSVLGGGGQPAAAIPEPQRQEANDQATVLIRAMVNAAKSDGRVDQKEQENIVSKLGNDISEAEINFLKEEFAAPLDVENFARSVPRGLEQQVYFLSLTSIELDTQNEAQYLGKLAQSMNLDPNLCNQIHDQIGAPKIFA